MCIRDSLLDPRLPSRSSSPSSSCRPAPPHPPHRLNALPSLVTSSFSVSSSSSSSSPSSSSSSSSSSLLATPCTGHRPPSRNLSPRLEGAPVAFSLIAIIVAIIIFII
eukprot:997170-Pyramimonas_sp.AAC.1